MIANPDSTEFAPRPFSWITGATILLFPVLLVGAAYGRLGRAERRGGTAAPPFLDYLSDSATLLLWMEAAAALLVIVLVISSLRKKGPILKIDAAGLDFAVGTGNKRDAIHWKDLIDATIIEKKTDKITQKYLKLSHKPAGLDESAAYQMQYLEVPMDKIAATPAQVYQALAARCLQFTGQHLRSVRLAQVSAKPRVRQH